VIGLAHGFGLTVVAEGVEEQAQLDWLRQAGCDFVQGYLMARPLPFGALAERVAAIRVPAA
jgi:EAL domain-containing protein (putative c-di-GMP-specific phosphodiesterase class I)